MTDGQIISKVAEMLNSTSAAIISEYTFWIITSASIWLGLAAGCFTYLKQLKIDSDLFEGEGKFFRVVGMALCLFIIGLNLPNLLNPKAAAIHQLIDDAR